MTREEIKKAMRDTKREVVIKSLHKLLSLVEGYPEYEDCISYAITELEQKPVLDRVRAEIEKIELLARYTRGDIKQMALDVIDKYKAESKG